RVTVEQVLAVATSNLDHNAEIRQQPKVEATLRLALGRTFYELGRMGEADFNLRRAFDLRRRELGRANSLTRETELWLGTFLFGLDHKHDEAGTYFREVWQARYQALGAEHPHTLDALKCYQITLNQTAHFKEAEQIARYILSIRERT